ncbi:DUF5134 domain-containing protein [Streptomyces canus]|uniref:DUF5134 domain-containing protein n=1 Tax=Streptomyces canus TaxID=58343 RepID=UPI002256D5F1|nr:DUF5134 domain-containing protein [Streptomyces canus]MCX4862192.1 DUF5134 domain-containing protein [Streptomyces canus]WSW32817.1 DUF5134 domain-containing protein [Streptomyces canus]
MDLGTIGWTAGVMALVLAAAELPRLAARHAPSRHGAAAEALMDVCMAVMACPLTMGVFTGVGWWPVVFGLAGAACLAAGARAACVRRRSGRARHWFQHAVGCAAMACMVLAMRADHRMAGHGGMTMPTATSGWAIACAVLACYFVASMALALWRDVVSERHTGAEAVPVTRIAMAGVTAVMLLAMV